MKIERFLPAAMGGAMLAICAVVITWFSVLAEGLDRGGLALLTYHVARLVLAVLLGYAVYACGRVAMRDTSFPGALIAGLSMFSLGAFVLGLIGGYYTIVAIALVVAVTFLAPPMRPREELAGWWRQQTAAAKVAVAAIVVLTAILFVNRALVPAETDNDVWEHYLHYYDAVLRNHSIWPNELWVHFYVSKAAGAFYMAGLLGDVFSVQVVSWLAVLMMAVLVHSLIRGATGSTLAGLAGALLLLASWNVLDGRAGSFLKHHTVLAALMLSIFWCGYEGTVREEGTRRRVAVLAGAATGFYIGLYITVAAGIAAAGLVGMAVYFALFRQLRARAWIPLALTGAPLGGAAVALAINYAWTGLALDAPVGIFWPLADRERFARIWSPLLVEYWFLGPASFETAKASLASVITPDLEWWSRLLRVAYLKATGIVALAAVGAAVLWKFVGKGSFGKDVHQPLIAAGAVLAFLSGVLVLSQVFRNSESVYRLYAFTLPLVLCALVLLWQAAAAASGSSHLVPVQWITLLAALVCAAAMLRQVPAERWRLVGSYAIGSASTRDTLRHAERSFPGRVTMDFISEFRARFPGNGRILFLTYDPAPAYFVPGPPVLSEPSYAFGSHYEEMLFAGDPGRTEELLKQEGIEYVAFNLRNRLFLGLPYAELFSARAMPTRLGLAWQRDGIIVLGWRSAGVMDPVPQSFLAALEAKKTGDIPDDAAERWGPEVAGYMRAAKATKDQSGDYLGWLYDEMKARSTRR